MMTKGVEILLGRFQSTPNAIKAATIATHLVRELLMAEHEERSGKVGIEVDILNGSICKKESFTRDVIPDKLAT
jgi:hypothetical protein